MSFEKQTLEKQEAEYRVLQRALGGSGDYEKVKKAFTPKELEVYEHRLAHNSWDAKFLPQLVAAARQRLAEGANG